MATVPRIKETLSFTDNCFGISPKTVTDAQIARLKAAFEGTYAEELDGAEATAGDFGALLWRWAAPFVTKYEERVRDAANTEPAVGEFTA